MADRLAMHPRTVQRRLTAEGTSFEILVDDVRREIVAHHLRDTDLPLSRLATMAGYSEQSSLTRGCKRWFGATPTRCRRADGFGVARSKPV
ncbi:helix-turn-helix transcriptional regulator [Ilumatobacter sp.]|uniref:helix-turn-helix transcriptional regulator n=1 Tax=Ilumatobacter sp. TaxID=1967498 RepID=UPI003C47D75C